MRDLLVGLTVVRADGTVVKAGGRVVKNVTGYDIPKLHVGAYGTLGVVVEAHLRLHPRPAEERSWVFGFASAEAALEAALDVRDTPVVLSRCQLLLGGALRALGETTPAGAALAVTIGSVPEAVRAQAAEVADICGRRGSAAIEVPAGRRLVASGSRRSRGPRTGRRASRCASAPGRPTSSRRSAWSRPCGRATRGSGPRPTSPTACSTPR